jgi:coenzyme F420 hydrogenase subunit beta
MLRNGLADGVVGIVPAKERDGILGPLCSENGGTVRSAMQSKYTVVPTNCVIRELLSLKGKYVYVGLPCQVQGLRKAEALLPALKDKVALCLGLFCRCNMSDDATAFLVRKSGIP